MSMEGAKVLMLEAGSNYVPARETAMFKTRDPESIRICGVAETIDGRRGFDLSRG